MVLLVTFGSVSNPLGGLAVRARTVLDALVDLGIATVVISTEEPVATERVAGFPVRITKSLLGFPHPVDTVRLIAEYRDKATAVIVESAVLLPLVVAAGLTVPIIWDTNECETLHYSRLTGSTQGWLKLRVWQLLEYWAARRCTLAVAISDAEAVWWRKLFPTLRGKLVVIPHRALVRVPLTAPTVGPMAAHSTLLFVGNCGAKHNRTAAEWLLEVLAPALPITATLRLVGPGTETLRQGPAHASRVECVGTVSDIDSEIAAADICLAPLLSGAGVKTKVLHYIGHQKPVIGTPTSFEGIEDCPGCLAVPLDAMVNTVLQRLESPEGPYEAQKRQAAQRAWFVSHQGKEEGADHWGAVLQSVGVFGQVSTL